MGTGLGAGTWEVERGVGDGGVGEWGTGLVGRLGGLAQARGRVGPGQGEGLSQARGIGSGEGSGLFRAFSSPVWPVVRAVLA